MDWKPMPDLNQIDINLFKNKMRTVSPNGCIIWQGSYYSGRYGRFYIKGIGDYLAHRISYYIHYQIDPKELLVCHDCNIEKCVNPLHLFLGNNSLNQRQAFEQGRKTQKRENNNACKLNENQIKEIRYLLNHNVIYSTIAKRYNISTENVYQINHHTWRDNV